MGHTYLIEYKLCWLALTVACSGKFCGKKLCWFASPLLVLSHYYNLLFDSSSGLSLVNKAFLCS